MRCCGKYSVNALLLLEDNGVLIYEEKSNEKIYNIYLNIINLLYVNGDKYRCDSSRK